MEHSLATITSAASMAPCADPAWLDRQLYPFRGFRHGTREGALHYLDEGRGRPLLFVHGTPSWSFEWRSSVLALRDRYRCVAPDHLGFGLSDKPPHAGYRPEDHARRLLELVRALDLRDVTLVLHDFGGPMGLPVLLEEPSRVRAVVLLNTWFWAHGEDPRVRRLSRLVASPLGRFLYLGLNASPRWLVPASFARRERLSRQVHRQYVQPFARRGTRRGPFVLGCELAGSDPFYARLWAGREALQRVPVTLLWGMADPAFGPSYFERLSDELPRARTVELHDVGHFPQEEAPERVNAALEESLGST